MHLKVLRELGDGVIMRLCSCHLRDDKLGRVADTLEGRSAIENGLDLLAETSRRSTKASGEPCIWAKITTCNYRVRTWNGLKADLQKRPWRT